jgi:DNA-binding response OmpR family regulator
MFKCQEDQIAVLGVCVDSPATEGAVASLNYHAVHNGRRGVDMLRMVSFDIVLVGLKLPDMSVWDFLRHLRTAFPNQKWAMVGGPISEKQEVQARMFGCTTLFDTTPTGKELMQLTARMREQAISTMLSGKYQRPAAQQPQIRSAT